MTITIPSPTRRRKLGGNRRGLTLVEVMVGASLGGVVLSAVMSAFLFLGRSGANISNYNDMEGQARKALELFAEDTRQASNVFWTNSTSVTLTVNAASVVYTFSGGDFRRTANGTTTTLITGVTTFNFLAYTITGAAITDFSTAAARTTANNTTKQIQISLSAARTTRTVATATNIVLSARYVLRNKRVTA